MTADTRRTMYLGPWRVDIVMRLGVEKLLSWSAIARLVQQALSAAGAPEPASVTVVLTDDEELTDLNREQMGHEGPTDVLSFPMLPPGSFAPHGPSGEPGRAAHAKELVGGKRAHIGDIAISVERAIEQAQEGRGGQTGDARWSPADELRLIVTHGTLHLCGWDHAEPNEETEMRALEQRLLS